MIMIFQQAKLKIRSENMVMKPLAKSYLKSQKKIYERFRERIKSITNYNSTNRRIL